MLNSVEKSWAVASSDVAKEAKKQVDVSSPAQQSQTAPLFKITRLETERAAVVLEQCCIR